MTICQQDFTTFQGDPQTVTVEVYGQDAEHPLDLSAATNIEWSVKFDDNFTVTKTMLGGGILVSDAAQGVVNILLDAVDTRPWLGIFPHQMAIIDDVGNRSVVMNGVMTVGKAIVP